MTAARRLVRAALDGAAAVLLVPAAVLAHVIAGGREDLPIPRWLFGWEATAVLVVSFVAIAVV